MENSKDIQSTNDTTLKILTSWFSPVPSQFTILDAVRKHFWQRNGLKASGSQETASQVGEDGSHQEPVVIGARYSYTSLISGQITRSNSSSPPPLLPSQYRSTNKSSTSTSHHGQRHLGSTKGSTSSTNRKASHHKRHVSSSTPHKSFNAFLEDTNDEWEDSMEDDKRIKQPTNTKLPQVLPQTKSSTQAHSPLPSAAKSHTIDETRLTDHSSATPARPPSPPPPSSATTTTTTAAYTSSVLPELEHKLNITNNPLADEHIYTNHTSPPNVNGIHRSDNITCAIDNLEDILKDPTFILHQRDMPLVDPIRTKRMKEALCCANVDLLTLQSICWNGIPSVYRPIAWQLLLGYLPCNSERRVETLARKRKEYLSNVKAQYSGGNVGLDQSLWHQIHIDILRTNPTVLLYQSTITQECLERILYQWAIRHPATGYVQGINDLLTPIFEVFLSTYIYGDPETCDMSKIDQNVLDVVEADSFWCLSKLLDGIQDNYTFAQPGIQRQISTLQNLVARIDARLASHLEQEGVEFIQFAFRWMNCLLMRELPLKNTIRMWDTYLAEGSTEGFSEFHVFVCAAFLVKWSAKLQKMDFQEIMIFLQQLPTGGWQEKDVELLLSEAYMWKSLFFNAPNHLKNR